MDAKKSLRSTFGKPERVFIISAACLLWLTAGLKFFGVAGDAPILIQKDPVFNNLQIRSVLLLAASIEVIAAVCLFACRRPLVRYGPISLFLAGAVAYRLQSLIDGDPAYCPCLGVLTLPGAAVLASPYVSLALLAYLLLGTIVFSCRHFLSMNNYRGAAAVGLVAVFSFSNVATAAEPFEDIVITGGITCSFCDNPPAITGQTNWFQVLLKSDAFQVRCGAVMDPQISLIEYGSLGRDSTYQWIVYKPIGSGRNESTLTLLPTWQPERSAGFYPAVWLAYPGGAYFEQIKGSEIPPVSYMPQRARQVGVKHKAVWQLSGNFVETLTEFHGGKIFSEGPLSNLLTEEVPNLAGQTNLHFSVQRWTNALGLRIPAEFSLATYYRKQKGDSLSLYQTLRGEISSVRQERWTERNFQSQVLTNAQVYEERLEVGGSRIPTIGYFVTNGPLRTLEDLKSSSMFESAKMESDKRKRVETRIPPFYPIFILAALVIPGMWLAVRLRARRGTTGRP